MADDPHDCPLDTDGFRLRDALVVALLFVLVEFIQEYAKLLRLPAQSVSAVTLDLFRLRGVSFTDVLLFHGSSHNADEMADVAAGLKAEADFLLPAIRHGLGISLQ